MCPLQPSAAAKSLRQRGPGTCYDYKEKDGQTLSRSTGRVSTLLRWVEPGLFREPPPPSIREAVGWGFYQQPLQCLVDPADLAARAVDRPPRVAAVSQLAGGFVVVGLAAPFGFVRHVGPELGPGLDDDGADPADNGFVGYPVLHQQEAEMVERVEHQLDVLLADLAQPLDALHRVVGQLLVDPAP